MNSETDSIIAFIEQRADKHQDASKNSGQHQADHGATAADYRALASDIKAGLHRA